MASTPHLGEVMSGTHHDIMLKERDFLVVFLKVRIGQNRAPLKHHCRLDDRGHTARAFQMSNVGLDRTYEQWVSRRVAATEDSSQGSSLERIPRWRSRTVGFDVRCITRLDLSARVDGSDQGLLSRRVRYRDSRSPSILIQTTIPNNCSYAVASRDGVTEWFENDASYAFAATEASPTMIEREAPSHRIENPGHQSADVAAVTSRVCHLADDITDHIEGSRFR